ncbi:MAG: alpha-glucan family phosphorylase [Bacteroidales bacterium]
MNKQKTKADYIFETSWEVCNKIGGIHTVISTKAHLLTEHYGDNYITIGPDVWKETHRNPEFTEDEELYRTWREYALQEGINLRIGRWQIPGQPVAVLVDFTPLFSQKDKIFSDYWLKFGLNSLSGQWDYTEPAMFGYAVGQVIESFYDFYLTAHDRFVAHFHEWMTGTGVLYLKDRVPQAGKVFTTHATTLGRSISGRGMALYDMLEQIDPEAKASELNIASKFSLEKVAAHNADSFTTVSSNTATECEFLLGKKPDVITPNGFDPNLKPSADTISEKRQKARNKLLGVASGLLNQDLPENTLLIAHSGRYEYRNKGIDILIESLGNINRAKPDHPVVTFIMIPAGHDGPRKELADRMQSQDYKNPLHNEYLTHKLHDPDSDIILQHFQQAGLFNRPEDNVKVVFIPAYLNGEDGLINMNYYDLLLGFDTTVFPSYYEPWGYTPMESIAMQVPTVTSSLSGFARWVTGFHKDAGVACHVLKRDDYNKKEVIEELTDLFKKWLQGVKDTAFTAADHETDPLAHGNLIDGRRKSREIADSISWDKLISYYEEAFQRAVKLSGDRYDQFKDKKQPAWTVTMPPVDTMRPKWKKVTIDIKVPEPLKSLPELARNLWWTWNYEATELFETIDPELWETCKNNPVILLDNLSMDHYERLINDKAFMKKYDEVVKNFKDYMDAGKKKTSRQIAYYSMEYGLHETIKIYSGGLGVLAGDHLKQASDDNSDLIGIGLLYRYGYFTQSLSLHGEQVDTYHPHDFASMSAVPVRDENGKRIKISIAFPGRTLQARIWRVDVGRVPLYLLDTDISENAASDRFITHQLYGGDWENRFKQEFLLGIGGIRVLDALGLKPDVFHCNEGHAAFTGLERLRKIVMEDRLSFREAMEVVRASSLFTTHTPVPAGHDFFSEDMLRTYMPHYADRLGISWDNFMGLGKMNPQDPEEDYSMSVLAAKLSQQINGVSKIHGAVSRNMLNDLYPGYFPEELHIGHVTNGVHYGSWTAKEWQQLYKETFGSNFLKDVSNPSAWEKIYDVPDKKIWDIRNARRKELLDFLRQRMLNNLERRQETPRKIYQLMDAVDENTLTVGFARRFATYKRAHLLFNDLERLSKIVNDPDQPVQFIYAGKAHPADKAGQELIKHILEISRRKEFQGKIIFLEDYDMELGRELVKGVDIWLNTPTRPMEASGTSGQKATLNGVMNFSVLDGWWAEGYVEETGWKLKEEKTFENQEFQNEMDAETIYNTFENEIAPMFYDRDTDGIPVEWVRWIKNCIARVAPHYTNKRMLDDYFKTFYNPLFDSSEKISKNKYKAARELVHWKNKIIRAWDSIEVVDKKLLSNSGKTLLLGEVFRAELILDIGDIQASTVGVEVIFVRKSTEGKREVVSVYEMEQKESKENQITFTCEVPAERTGEFNYAFRMFPKNPALAHRQDFNLIRWI